MNPSKKRIALVANTAWSLYNFRLGLIKALKDNGYEVLLIAPRDRFAARLVAEGFSFFHFPMENYGTNPLIEASMVPRLYRIYRELKPDFIFHYTIKLNIYGSLAAKLLGIPSVAVTTGLGHFLSYKNPVVRWITRWMYRLAVWCSKEIWFLNEEDRDIFINRRIAPRIKTYLLPSEGIDTQYFLLNGFQQPQDEIIRFLFAGRLLKDKGVVDFVDAARILKKKYEHLEFQILGFIDPNNPNSITYAELEAWQQQGLVKYLGEAEDVRPYLGACDCLVFPSIYREGISRILLEAASMSRPIITTDHVGCRDVVQHGVNGWLCESKDVEDLAEKMQSFMETDSERLQKMGRASRDTILKQFDEKKVVAHYLKCLERYVGRGQLKY